MTRSHDVAADAAASLAHVARLKADIRQARWRCARAYFGRDDLRV